MSPVRSARAAVSLLVLAAAPGCARPEPPEVAVACSSVRPTGAAAEVRAVDPLELFVVFDSVPGAQSGGVRLRVDPLGEAEFVRFAQRTPTAAAAGMTLRVPARYHGCAGTAPWGLELRAPFPPRGKAWVRVATDRPVRLHVRVGGRTLAPALTRPGSSALHAWDRE